jgi:hypothetical protein
MLGLLDDCRAKAAWGKSHVDQLKADILAWKYLNHTPPFSTRKKFEPQAGDAGKFSFWIDHISPLPVEWSLVIGDALNNYRAALDHMAWTVVWRNPPSRVREGDVMFPHYEIPAKFDGNLGRRLPGVDQKVIDIIKQYQPFSPGPASDTITALIELNNIDKHREIRPVIGQMLGQQQMSYEATNFSVRHVELFPGSGPGSGNETLAYKPDTHLVDVFGVRKVGGEPDVTMKFEGSYGIAFENGRWAIDVLDGLETAVGAILDEVEAAI